MRVWALTGGGGYIGSELAKALVACGHSVRALARSTPAQPIAGVSYVLGDVRDAAVLPELVHDAEFVVHLAAFVHRRADSARRRRECYSINVDGTRALVTAMQLHAPSAFLVHVSTANVYPDSSEPADELADTRPRTYYGVTKLESEAVVRAAMAANELRGAVVRPAMVFGPGAPGNLRRLVRFVQRGRILLIGDGANQKSLAPVETLVAAIIAIASSQDRANGEIYNVSGGELSMLDISRVIADELRVSPRVTRLPAGPLKLAGTVFDAVASWSPLPSLRQMVTTYASPSVISGAKLNQLASFRAPIELEHALRATVRAFSASR